MPKPYSLFLTILWSVLLGSGLYGQEIARSDSTRFFSFGFSAGTPHQVAFANTNPSGQYLTNSPLLSFKTGSFAVHSHFLKPNGLGYGLDFGFRQFFMAISKSPGQSFLGGRFTGEFRYNTFFLAPQLVYNFKQKSGDLFNLSSGLEIHLATGANEYTFDNGTYFVDPASSFVLLRLGVEYQKKLSEKFWAGLYLNLTQGVTDIAVLNFSETNRLDVSNLGTFKGTGFEFGVRVSVGGSRD